MFNECKKRFNHFVYQINPAKVETLVFICRIQFYLFLLSQKSFYDLLIIYYNFFSIFYQIFCLSQSFQKILRHLIFFGLN